MVGALSDVPARAFVNMLLDVRTIAVRDAVMIDPLATVTVDMLMAGVEEVTVVVAVVITLEFTLPSSSAVDILADVWYG